MQNIPDMAQIMRLAQSPAGQQLFTLLQSASSSGLQDALQKANAGDYAGAKNSLTPLLSSPEIQALLKQLEESK